MIDGRPIAFGDTVRIVSTAETLEMGLAGCIGQVYGLTTPSVTGIEMIGHSQQDHAINVYFDDRSEGFWFAPELVEFVDHAPGTTIKIGDKTSIRQADGQWLDSEAKPSLLTRIKRFFH